MDIRRQGYYNLARLVADNYALTDDITCARVFIPDNDGGRRALMTVLNILTHDHAWFASVDDSRKARAAMWQSVFSMTLEELGGGCVDCGDLIECLSDPAFIEALDGVLGVLMSDPASALYKAVIAATGSSNNTPTGLPPSEEYLNQNWVGGTNPECDLDILYGQCLAVVVETNRGITDTLEQLEVLYNAGEFVQILANLPILAAVAESLGSDAVLGVIDKTLEFLAEGYIAAYTEEFETAVACALFCACQDDCQITAQRIIDVMHERVTEHGTFPLLGNLFDWVGWYNDNIVFGSAIADVAYWAAWSALGAMGSFFLKNANVGVELTIQKAANNPDPDWEFCDTCTYTHIWNAENGWDGWDLLSWADQPIATIVDGIIVGADDNSGLTIFIYMGREMPVNVDSVKVFYEYVRIDNANTNAIYLTTPALTPVYGTNTLPPVSGDTFVETTTTPSEADFRVLTGIDGQNGTGQYLRIKEIRAKGEKPDPF